MNPSDDTAQEPRAQTTDDTRTGGDITISSAWRRCELENCCFYTENILFIGREFGNLQLLGSV
ncbi:hypothetical protein J6590_062858 [Homalodisca vitripennis]|nr:hypothetical protein J6590_062858 [Homalodisca vitripennis]